MKDEKTLAEWAVYLAACGEDAERRTTVSVNGRRLKKTFASRLDALMEQADKKDGEWTYRQRQLWPGYAVWEFTTYYGTQIRIH